jgi:hypothetical protein
MTNHTLPLAALGADRAPRSRTVGRAARITLLALAVVGLAHG